MQINVQTTIRKNDCSIKPHDVMTQVYYKYISNNLKHYLRVIYKMCCIVYVVNKWTVELLSTRYCYVKSKYATD
jgi:inosine-uridine nucleoside N-ribohydrolase